MTIAQGLISRFDELMEEFPVPAADAVEALAHLVRTNQAEKFSQFMKGEKSNVLEQLEEIQDFYNREPEKCEREWRDLASTFRSEYASTARRKLTSLTKIELVNTVERTQAEKTNLLADSQGGLLELSVAEDLISRIADATRRSGLLQTWSVNHAFSEEADEYLAEASSCFIYGFFTSCAVMCRSLLEEVLERKLPAAVLRDEEISGKRTLGGLLTVVNNNMQECGISLEVPKLIKDVNRLGSQAAHKQSLLEGEALDCLNKTRLAVCSLLS